MTSHGGPLVRRLTATAVCIAMTCALGACSSSTSSTGGTDATGAGTGTATTDPGSVAIFTPSDGVTISGNTPLNKWTAFVPELTKALRNRSFPKKSISSSTADSLDEQSRDVQDYVVDRISSKTGSSSSDTTIVVAPVTDPDDTTRQYGDVVSHDGASDADDETAADRLTSALSLAKENGMHVVMLSDTVPGVVPDAYVRMSTAEAIGKVQATKLVDKLALNKVSKDNPKYVEVLLPYSPDTSGEADDTSATDGSVTGGEAFAAAAFKGVWSVLGPYFASGQAVSLSSTLTSDTTADDWRDVAFVSGKEDSIRAELRGRLGLDDADDKAGIPRIDGIIAMNDYTASGVVDELSDLGYTGSAADINPQITISGIVENITGRKDLVRGKVPDPVKAPSASDGSKDAGDDARWPIVTGYGAYVDAMPRIVAGQQWMTALEDRATLAEDTAQTCLRLNTVDGDGWRKGLKFLKTTKVNGKNTPTVSVDLLAVSASNLKTALINPGYISLADAGL
ncbi:hypothetical protein [Bifidobacterium saguinibicoloris]|uniref:hypothetical protein n=1 Tax=Bifidobacterium saguinibicoloris TaxID=2834433 RepID=UPI001C5704B7|nr:hypothetical protein [Bifidobacterium saguinibicoloris]MBW3079976.1 hypothetical protein [Bifidobacterium saguinibicoloris]